MTTYVWRRTDLSSGLGFVRLDEGDSITAEGYEIAANETGSWAVKFHMELDARWRTRRADVAVVTEETGRHLVIEGDGDGHWRIDGQPAAHLDGCLDVDIAATPFTNTFVIRRLGLTVGGGERPLRVSRRALRLVRP